MNDKLMAIIALACLDVSDIGPISLSQIVVSETTQVGKGKP